MLTQNLHWKYGVLAPDGSKRYTSMTNGGPIFVYVKNGKIVRTTTIEFDDDDPGTGLSQPAGKILHHPEKQHYRRMVRTGNQPSIHLIVFYIR